MRVQVSTAAEEVIAGVAAISYTGALAATDRLRPEHFYDPRCARVLEVGARTPDTASFEDRIDLVATEAGVWPAWLRSIVARCPVQWDVSGRWADRVLAEHDRRQRIRAAWELLQDVAA